MKGPQPTPQVTQEPLFVELDTWRRLGLTPQQQIERAQIICRYHMQRMIYFKKLWARLEKELVNDVPA